jgi:hypothetical protein
MLKPFGKLDAGGILMNVRERGYDNVNWIELARTRPNGLIDSNDHELRAFLYCTVNMYLT